MKAADRQTRSHLMRLFEHQGIHPRHDLGQNFLIDLNLIDLVVDQAALGPEDVILEIGAGTGGLTTHLAQWAGEVVSVEIDPRVHALARLATDGLPNVTLLLADALENKNQLAPVVLEAVSEKLAVAPGRGLKLVANLPYSVATPVISNLIATELPWKLMIVTIQWELALRMKAAAGTDDYSALSVWLQSQSEIEIVRRLGSQVFWPRPQVDSAIVRLAPDPERRAAIGDRPFFHEFIRRLFTQRRKTLRSVLAGMYREKLEKTSIETLLQSMNLHSRRAEELDVPTLVELARAIRQLLNPRGAT
jgi:16S rRNA (adenine1518-N6/adenine1519-N6)-dimethyltransferase